MKVGTIHHLKTKRLSRLLGTPLYRTVGILETLWQIAGQCAIAGDIGRYSDAEIAEALEWDGSPEELVAALCESGYIDANGLDAFDKCCRLTIHDWADHCPDFIKKRIARGRQRTTTQKDLRQNNSDNGGQRRTTDAETEHRLPSVENGALTIPNQSIPHHPQPNPRHGVGVVDCEAHNEQPESRQPTVNDAGDRLRAAQVSQWSAALSAATEHGCSPEHVIRLADFAADHGFGPGALYARVLNAHPSTPVESGWPPPTEVQKSTVTAARTDARRKADDSTRSGLEKRIGPIFDSMSVDEQDALAYRKWSPSGRENGDILRFRSRGAGRDNPEIRIPLLALLQQELHQRGELGAIAAGAAFNAPSTDAVSHRRPECQATEFWNHVGGGRYCRICYPPTDAKAVKPPEAMRA